MTDPGVADVDLRRAADVEMVEDIVRRERPDGILATLGGQTGLNLAVACAEAGVFERLRRPADRHAARIDQDGRGPRPVQADAAADRRAGARQRHRHTPSTRRWRSRRATATRVIVRPAFTLGGTGGGQARDEAELRRVAASGLAASPVTQVLVEQSLIGWKELEYEVLRDAADTCIVVCNMENIDPMGVHTGDSIVVAPSQTLSDHEYQMLRTAAHQDHPRARHRGGCNVQFALDPQSRQYYVIEVNPRVSRSSALASKATGYPIARVSAKIAIGKRLDEIPNAVTQQTTAAFEPALDYLVVKIPRFPFDKFGTGDRALGTQMKATGEVMAIDRSFEGALQKAVRSLEFRGRSLLWEEHGWSGPGGLERDLAADRDAERPPPLGGDGGAPARRHPRRDPAALGHRPVLRAQAGAAGRDGAAAARRAADHALLWRGQAARVLATPRSRRWPTQMPEQVRARRREWGLRPVYKMVDTCAAEFEAVTPYFYGSYEQENEAEPLTGPKAAILGSGPIRIGQGIEFDYCSVRAARRWRASAARAS